MTQTIVNLTLTVVTEKIEEVLAQYPADPHHPLFATAGLKQKLAAYVLNRMPTLYATVDSPSCSLQSPTNCYTLEQHQQITGLIREGIEYLTAQEASWESAAESSTTTINLSPSTWFG